MQKLIMRHCMLQKNRAGLLRVNVKNTAGAVADLMFKAVRHLPRSIGPGVEVGQLVALQKGKLMPQRLVLFQVPCLAEYHREMDKASERLALSGASQVYR